MVVCSSAIGNIFFVATGFHGLHVLVGLTLLSWTLVRALFSGLASGTMAGFECVVWYWHFVDVVWLFLFTMVY